MSKEEPCPICRGKKYLVCDYEGRPAVMRCDECQWFGEDDPRTLWDEDAAILAHKDGIKSEDTYPCFIRLT